MRFSIGVSLSRGLLVAALALFLSCPVAVAAPTAESTDSGEYRPKVAEASDEGARALKRIRAPQGFRVELFAAEPHLANPVAFCTDEQGRFYVAETFRHHAGVTDNRNHMYWLADDLAARTVEDRVAMYRKHLGERFAEYTTEQERVRLIEDRDGDGRADHSTIFADGFGDAADGIGAGLLARRGELWFACIPTLWKMRDTNGDGAADERESLHTGYGVHVAFLGHDLHGLIWGPDGKLYFSIGDRGLNVTTREGRRIELPDTGAVLRCNPDGSELEVFAFGLRNPQELAFDEYGNLFTGENNSDGGDKARWVHVVEGGDSGWRIGYQYLNTPIRRGPWNHEKLWTPEGAREAAYLVPPLLNLGDGPSGLSYYPGTGLTPDYRGSFFLADFRGSSGQSGIRTFKLKPAGASFEVVDSEQFVWSVLATDVDFGPDSAMYITDWVEGWDKPGKGRIYKVTPESDAWRAEADAVRKLIAEGMENRDSAELLSLLRHPDMRIRREAQFTLAERGAVSIPALTQLATTGDHQLARIHALWGLGQLARREPGALAGVSGLLTDGDAELRAQAAKIFGDARHTDAHDQLVALLKDESPRVQFRAAQALGKVGGAEDVPAVLAMLSANDDRDAFLRHAGVMALVGINDPQGTIARADDASPAVRRAVLLALRRSESPEVARFLDDADASLVLEAARAINDVPIADALPKLAALASREQLDEALALRVLNANFRVGGAAGAAALANYAADGNRNEVTRVEALNMLAEWAQPADLDRVMGLWRPLEDRAADEARQAIAPLARKLLAGTPDKVAVAASRAAANLNVAEAGEALRALAADAKRGSAPRIEALRALAAIDDPGLEQVVKIAVADEDASVRGEGRRWLVKLNPADAVPIVLEVLESGTIREQQAAIASLGEMESAEVDALLASLFERLAAGSLKPEAELDLLAAAERRASSAAVAEKLKAHEQARPQNDPLAAFRECLTGGDAARGREIFFDRTEAACLRCHRLGTRGGEVGPVLNSIGLRENREYLLEALVAPNQKIAKGFESVVLALDDGEIVTGVFKNEDDQAIELMTPEGKLVKVEKSRVEERDRGPSAMPDQALKVLSKSDIRDLVEFLATLR